jgi:AraC-like DNA-binding protein
MAYDILQDLKPTLLLIENRSTLAAAVGLWSIAYKHTSWMMDYWGGQKVFCRVNTPDGKTQTFERRNTWHLYAPGVAYQERYEDRSRWEMLWFQFTLSGPLPPLTARPFTALSDPEGRLTPYARAIHDSQQRSEPGGDLIRRGLLQAILGEVVAAGHRGHAGTPEDPWSLGDLSAEPSLLQRVDGLILKHLASPPSLDELAESLSMSVSSLTHRFKSETGMTLVERIRWLRVREARLLLTRRGADVKSVAQRLGFSSPFYFSKVFREVAGITAVEYLRRNRA